MKKVHLIAAGEFGENLCELLEFEGFRSHNLGISDFGAMDKNLDQPDLYICEAETLRSYRKQTPTHTLDQYPYILLSEDGLPQHDLPQARHHLQIPFSAREFIEAVNICMEADQAGAFPSKPHY